MIEINFYQPPKINMQVKFPSAWDELTGKELYFIAKTLLQQNEGSVNETKPKILHYLIEQRATALPKDWMLSMEPSSFMDAYPIIDFIFRTNDRTVCPKIKGRTINFEDITCGEFEDTEPAAFRFLEDPSQKPLAEIAAVLFRPRNKKYIRWQWRNNSYKTYPAAKKVKQFLKLNPQQLYAMFIWYAGNKNQLPLYFPYVYEGKKGQPDPMIFTNTIHAGAGPKNGSRDDIRRMKLFEFLYDCNQEAKKAAELEAEYKKMNK